MPARELQAARTACPRGAKWRRWLRRTGHSRFFIEAGSPMPKESNWRIALLALGIVLVDQLSKLIVQNHLCFGDQREVVKGFLRLVHWQNTGAAWSMFT